jgi:hypothetical protein
MEQNVMDLLTKQLNEDRDMLISAIAGGKVADFAEYKELCGQIRGISRAQIRVTEMVSRLRAGEQDD